MVDLGRGPLPSWRSWRGRVFSCAAFRSRESLAQRFSRLQSAGRARIARPRRSSPRRSTPPSPAVRSPPSRRPGPLAVRGTPAELEALVGQRLIDIRRRGKFLLARPRPRPRRRQPDAHRPLPARRAGREAADEDRGRPRRSAPRDGRRRSDRPRGRSGATWMPADDAAGRGPLPRPDPDGQGLPAAGRASTRPVPGLDDGELGPDADDPGADARRLAAADPPPSRAS